MSLALGAASLVASVPQQGPWLVLPDHCPRDDRAGAGERALADLHGLVTNRRGAQRSCPNPPKAQHFEAVERRPSLPRSPDLRVGSTLPPFCRCVRFAPGSASAAGADAHVAFVGSRAFPSRPPREAVTLIALRLLTADEDGPAFQVAGARHAGIQVVVVRSPICARLSVMPLEGS